VSASLRGLRDYADAYRSGRSVREVITEVLGRLAAAPWGVLIGEPLGGALDDADRLDAERIDGDPSEADRGLLWGAPFLVKDNIDVAGVTTTAACPGFAYPARTDAEVVARLRAAGAIVVGKTNLDQFATGLVGVRTPYGTPPNAIDADLVPGGSSSGSAVAVALDLVPFSLGTDTAGSGRIPAALNGVVGFKPSVGRWPTTGLVPAVPRIDCPSIFAGSVGDAVSVAEVIEGAPFAATEADVATGGPGVVGIATFPAGRLARAVADEWSKAVDVLGAIGAKVRELDVRPLLAMGELLYGSALVAQRAAAFGDAFAEGLEGLDPTVASIVAAAADYTAADAYRAEQALDEHRRRAREVLAGVDVLALPTTAHLPTLVEVAAEPIAANVRVGALTTFVNLVGLPAVVVPVTPRRPVGIQLVGGFDTGDDVLARFAERFAALAQTSVAAPA
jgi:allophanate hydrolase